MKCKNCGADINANSKYCKECGASNEAVSKDSKVKKFFNDGRVLIGLGVIASLVIIISGVLMFFNKGPKQIFNKTIDNLFKTVENKMEPINSNTLTRTANLRLEMNGLGEVGDIFNDLSLDLKYDIDYDKKILNMNVEPTYDQDTIINFSTYFNNDGAYIYLDKTFDKYIKLPIDKKEMNEMFNNNDNFKVVLEEMKKELKKSLSKKYFSKEKDEIKIDDEYVKVTKSTMTLRGKEMESFLKVYLTNLKNNDKIINNIHDKDIKDELDDSIKSLNVADSSEIIVTVYTKGLFNDFKGVTINIKSSDQSLKMDILKVDEDNYEYRINSNGTSIKGDIKVVEKDSKTVTSLSMNLGIANMKITVNEDVKTDVKVESKKIVDYIEVDDLTDADYKKIENSLMTSEGLIKLLTKINRLTNGY